MRRPPPTSTLFPYTTLFRSGGKYRCEPQPDPCRSGATFTVTQRDRTLEIASDNGERSEEHTSELQSPYDLVCRLLLEKKKKNDLHIACHLYISVLPQR